MECINLAIGDDLAQVLVDACVDSGGEVPEAVTHLPWGASASGVYRTVLVFARAAYTLWLRVSWCPCGQERFGGVPAGVIGARR